MDLGTYCALRILEVAHRAVDSDNFFTLILATLELISSDAHEAIQHLTADAKHCGDNNNSENLCCFLL